MIVLVPHERLENSDMSSYLANGTFAIFAMLLAAVVTSDLISEDLASSSFVLYFSRALKVRDYLAGKAAGALLVMSLMCAIPPVLVAFVSIATQTGSDYSYGFGVLGKTALVGALVTLFFVPFGLMISSFTKRKSYAAVGTFMSFFGLAVVAGIFSNFARGWRVISPIDSLSILFTWLYEGDIPSYVDKDALMVIVASLIIVPAAVVYFRLTRQVVGK
jgi:ABC-type transport system involved in multi-copper enzyme maturation permease subunit